MTDPDARGGVDELVADTFRTFVPDVTGSAPTTWKDVACAHHRRIRRAQRRRITATCVVMVVVALAVGIPAVISGSGHGTDRHVPLGGGPSLPAQSILDRSGQVLTGFGETAGLQAGYGSAIPPGSGDRLVTNIDGPLQNTLQQALDTQVANLNGRVDPSTKQTVESAQGAVVALDPQTGAVLALAWTGPTSPGLDPVTDSPATPGAVFDLVTATAALQDGLITPTSLYNDTGQFVIPGCVAQAPGCVPYTDNNASAAGYVNVSSALAVSSDTFFDNLGAEFWDSRSQYGTEPIQNVAAQYGYGQTTGIDLPGEDAGSYGQVDSPTVVAKEHAQDPAAYPYGSWATGNNVQMAAGLGGTTATPLQEAVAYATFANGGTRYTPRIAARIVDPHGNPVKTITAPAVGQVTMTAAEHQALTAGFTGAVGGPGSEVQTPPGSAAAAFQGFPISTFPIAGKTGYGGANDTLPASTFVGWGPTDHPTVLIATVIYAAGFGASPAAAVARAGFQEVIDQPIPPLS